MDSTVPAGLKDAVPFCLGAFAYGTVYGILARAGHLTLAQTLSMSVLVFAGASQFVALALLKQGAAGLAIVLATFFVNLRQVLYGLSLGPHLKGTGGGRLALLAHGLVDESYGVTMAAYAGGPGAARAISWERQRACSGPGPSVPRPVSSWPLYWPTRSAGAWISPLSAPLRGCWCLN
ncbi:MAG: AzlC family ABC transporter permease [Peptococcaceae bacterium]|nr:AzlC family ABC transporter permease [Peptococcaceae bacterium]